MRLSIYLIFSFLLYTANNPVSAQQTGWMVEVNGTFSEHASAEDWDGKSIRDILDYSVSQRYDAGFLEAKIDSFRVDSLQSTISVYTTDGPSYLFSEIHYPQDLPVRGFRLPDGLQTGGAFSTSLIEDAIGALELELARHGFWLAEISTEIIPESVSREVDVRFDMVPNPVPIIERIQLKPAGRTLNRYAGLLMGIRNGEKLVGFVPDEARSTLQQSGLFENVGLPEIRVSANSNLEILIPATELPPGNFDLVVGYLPGDGISSGQLVGNGRLDLVNLFGAGRSVRAFFDRTPGNARRFSAEFADPFIAGTRILGTVSFNGEQRDSTYNRYRLAVESGLRIDSRLSITGSYQQTRTRPGVQDSSGGVMNSVVSRSSTNTIGLGFRYAGVDNPSSPKRGLYVESRFEQGAKRLEENAGTRFSHQLISVEARAFHPTRRNHVLAGGVDFEATLGEGIDDSDLYRFGGATSLRGYNEEQFAGSKVGRFFLEYQVTIDRSSYIFVFNDWGFIETPNREAPNPDSKIKTGYGFGIQYGTPAGRVNVTYALNPDEKITGGKIHVGISLGL